MHRDVHNAIVQLNLRSVSYRNISSFYPKQTGFNNKCVALLTDYTTEDAMGEVYYEDFLKKREFKDQWIQYWARLLDEKIYLYVSRDCKELDFCEIIWLSSCSRCTLLKRRNYSFRFRLTTSEGSYYLKCDSNLQRHRWIHMIHLACSGRSPELPPNHINMRCCYREKEHCAIADGKRMSQNHSMENNNEERAHEMSGGKETIGEDEPSKASSVEEMAEMELRSSMQFTNENNRSVASEESVVPGDMTTNSQRMYKGSEKEIREEKQPCEKANDKTPTASSSEQEESPASFRQTFFKTFTFGSLRRSFRRQSYPPKQNTEPKRSKEQRNSVSYANYEEKITLKFSMDNPAFTDDDWGLEIDNANNMEESTPNHCPRPTLINVVSCND